MEFATTVKMGVTGMTCGHCEASVREELEEINGVSNVAIELNKGGTSDVRVELSAPVSEVALRDAVAEAGYEVEEIAALS